MNYLMLDDKAKKRIKEQQAEFDKMKSKPVKKSNKLNIRGLI